ncbi:hypothetical protein MUG84_26635 [Paenibacillus sp. KQZ6P-2]|uniref:Uncharacterized protein n=1 Tax=Paenibacillus mangrovi TaxID=2931978 RepID=A0A9X1WWN6_9BACL|nr:hypothetical protein [Paenibacillus mangrovi]MCJ8015250.1 hypothetical protein [Paenibacillus mangrovi]
MTPERLLQRIAARQRLIKTIKMKEVCNDSELDEIIFELEEELRRKELNE